MNFKTVALGVVASSLAVCAAGNVAPPVPAINLAHSSRVLLFQAAAKATGEMPWRLQEAGGWVGSRVSAVVDFMPSRPTSRAITYSSIACVSEDESLAHWSCNTQWRTQYADISPATSEPGCQYPLERIVVDPSMPMADVVEVLDDLATGKVNREIRKDRPDLFQANCAITRIYKRGEFLDIDWGNVGCSIRFVNGHRLTVVGCGLSVP